MALGLPKFRWLLIGAVAAGAWVVYDDAKNPRPPERVGAQKTQTQKTPAQRSAETEPRPQQTLAVTPEKKPEPARTVAVAKPVPPKPVSGKTDPQKTALALPKTIDRPPPKPEKIAKGSIPQAGKPVFVQTTTKVRLRAQARTDAEVIATLESRVAMREVARSGAWRLVVGDGRKGWVHADYLQPATFLTRRPKLPVADVTQAGRTASR